MLEHDSRQVQFEVDQQSYARRAIQPRHSYLVSLLMTLSGGKIRNTRQANVVLVCIVIVAFALTFLIHRAGTPEAPPGPIPGQVPGAI